VAILYAAHASTRNKFMEDGQMHMVKVLAALGVLTLSNLALAQTHFECGNVACTSNDPLEIVADGTATGINDIVVDGDAFNVTFTHTLPSSSPFVFSNEAAAPGQPLTGVDAANALESFLATQLEPSPLLVGGGPDLVTAFQENPTTGDFTFVVASTFFNSVDVPYTPVSVAANGLGSPVSVTTFGGGLATIWTPINAIAAPEIDPTSAASGLTLLLGGLVVLRGRRPGQRAA
jgi:hypothetical protein